LPHRIEAPRFKPLQLLDRLLISQVDACVTRLTVLYAKLNGGQMPASCAEGAQVLCPTQRKLVARPG
jgi:hypothetical protein